MRIRSRFVLLVVVAAASAAVGARPSRAQPADAVAAPSREIAALVAKLTQSARARDSLTALADEASGAARDFLEEQTWQRHSEMNEATLALVDEIESERNKGRDVTATLRVLNEGVRGEWPPYLSQ